MLVICEVMKHIGCALTLTLSPFERFIIIMVAAAATKIVNQFSCTLSASAQIK